MEDKKFEDGWKVCRKYKGRYYSYSTIFLDGPFSSKWLVTHSRYLEYPIGSPVYPGKGCGPMCLFKDEKSASRYVTKQPLTVLLPAKFIRSTERLVWTSVMGHVISLDGLPNDTVLADVIILSEV